jgi:putrescine transport system substrate-binding protein
VPLASLDKSKLPNLAHMDPFALGRFAHNDPGNAHAIPWM